MVGLDELTEYAAAELWKSAQTPIVSTIGETSTSPAEQNYRMWDWNLQEMYDCPKQSGWDPRWETVYQELVRSVRRPIWKLHYYEDRTLWHTCYELLAENGPMMQEAISQGVSMVDVEDRHPTKMGLMFGDLMMGVHDRSDRSRSDIIVNAARELNGFCLYGAVNCLVTSAAIQLAEPKKIQAFWGHVELPSVPKLLANAMTLLGVQGVFDMIESSWWPLRSMDIRLMLSNYLHLEKLGMPVPNDIVLYQRYAADDCLPGQPLPASCSQVSPHWSFYDAWQPNSQSEQSGTTQNFTKSHFTVAVFGLHGSLKMEPMTALRSACPEVHFNFRLLGTDCHPAEIHRQYQCKLLCSLQNRCHLLPGRTLNEKFGGHSGGILSDELGGAMHNVLEASHGGTAIFEKAVRSFQMVAATNMELSNLDLFICVDGIYCPLFRPRLTNVAFLLYLSHPLFNLGGDKEVLRKQLSDFQAELTGSRMLAAVAFPHLSASSYHAAGVRLPYIRSESMYLDHLRWQPEYHPGVEKNIIFPRTGFWRSNPGIHFHTFFERLLLGNGLGSRISCRFVNQRDFLEYEDMVKFHAAVLVPVVNYVMSFDEFYSLGVPLLLPNKEMLVRLLLVTAYTTFTNAVFNPDVRIGNAVNISLEIPAFVMGGDPLQPDPDDFRVLYFWHSLGPFGMYPYVLTFDSVPDLVHQLLMLSWESAGKLSGGMRMYVQRSRTRTMQWYRQAFRKLLHQ